MAICLAYDKFTRVKKLSFGERRKSKIGQEVETLESAVDLDACLIIESKAYEIASIVGAAASVEVARGDLTHLEEVFPPVGIIVVERVE